MKILFVCNQGMHRSPTAAKIWKEMNKEDKTDSIGIYNEKQDHKEKLEWADKVFVMEEHQRKWIADNYPKEYLRLKIINLDIKDVYGYMKDDLVKVLKKKLKKLI